MSGEFRFVVTKEKESSQESMNLSGDFIYLKKTKNGTLERKKKVYFVNHYNSSVISGCRRS